MSGMVMPLVEFRKVHSELIEHYQFIEFHLEGMYAAVCGKHLIDGLSDVEKDNYGKLINKIHMLEKQNNEEYLTSDECKRLTALCARRNFWCHNCYVDLKFDSKTGGLAEISDMQMLMTDFREAEDMRELTYNKAHSLLTRKGN